MNLSDEHKQQVSILSDFLNSDLAVTIVAQVEEQKVVGRLKGEDPGSPYTIINELIDHIAFLETKITDLERKEFERQEEMKSVVQVLHHLTKQSYDANNELTPLSARYGIY